MELKLLSKSVLGTRVVASDVERYQEGQVAARSAVARWCAAEQKRRPPRTGDCPKISYAGESSRTRTRFVVPFRLSNFRSGSLSRCRDVRHKHRVPHASG